MASSETPDLKQHILERIEREGVCPRSRWMFVGKEVVVWGAWVFTVLIGAVAVAISLFVIMHRQYAVYEATHETFWSFMFAVLPYLWFLVFVVGSALAIYHLRHTRRGYRYSLLTTAAVGMTASLAGGAVLHYVGMGFVFDKSLGHFMPGYWSQEMVEQYFWQQPEEGRILGTYVRELPDAVVVVEDVEGREWEVNVTELFPQDLELLKLGKQVRLLGRTFDGATAPDFHACSVFPWLYDHMMTMHELHEQRESAVERLHEQRERMVEHIKNALIVSREGGDTPVLAEPEEAVLCGEIDAVKRLED